MAFLLFFMAPLLVGLWMGIDRVITARMQNRVGPPIVQSFFDVLKLLGKQQKFLNSSQISFALLCLLFQALALAILVSGGDLLVVFFLSGTGSVFLALGAFSVRSPFSHLGAQRELLQIFAYEPVLLMAIVSIGYSQRTLLAGEMNHALLGYLPLSLAALVAVLVIKLQKSPYDISHAHTELISGPQIEYSGPYLAILSVAQWFEVAVVLGIMSLFFYDVNLGVSIVGKIVLLLVALFVCIVIDNASARLTRARMVRFTLSFGLALIALNLLWVYLLPGAHL